MNDLISIIVPVFNAERYVCACVESILAQTYTNFEVILIDDGSTDRSGTICDQLSQTDSRIKVVHQENKGPSAARNAGLDIIKGEYVCFIDSDDTVTPDYLKAFKFGYDLSIQGYKIDSTVTGISYKRYNIHEIPHGIKYYYCLNDISNVVWVKLFRSSIIQQHNIRFPTFTLSEDVAFSLTYLLYADSAYISDKMEYVYFIRNNNSLARKNYPLESLMAKEKYLYSLYDSIFQDDARHDSFLHEFSLFVLYKYFFNEHVDANFVKGSFLGKLVQKHLNPFERMILSMSYPLFCYYAIWRRRVKRKILRPLLHRYDTTLLNV